MDRFAISSFANFQNDTILHEMLAHLQGTVTVLKNMLWKLLRDIFKHNRQASWLVLYCSIGFIKFIYRKVVSSNTSCLDTHAGYFRLLMKGIFDLYVLSPFDKMLIF